MSTYVTASGYPSGTPTATIYIEGLLALCFKGEERCTVGFNQQGTHVPVFEVYERTSKDPPEDCKRIISALPDAQRIDIQVKRSGPNAVKVYNGTSPVGAGSHRYNFVNNCLDMEGARGHGSRVINRAAMLWPRVYINDGLFCAYKLSSANFELQGPTTKPLSKVPLAITADIFLGSGDVIDILADGKPLIPAVRLESTSHYEIGITNLCSPGASDFEKHYLALNVPLAAQYKLVSKSPTTGEVEPTVLGHCVKSDHDASDRAPCMAVVFGETEDFVD